MLALLRHYRKRLREVGLQVTPDVQADHCRETELSAYVQIHIVQADSAVMMPTLEQTAERGDVQ